MRTTTFARRAATAISLLMMCGPASAQVAFDPASNTVTMGISVQEGNGLFVPNLRRGNLAVYEDGVPQRNLTMELEHAPVTLAVLVEMGGRSQQLNDALGMRSRFMLRPILDVLNDDDKVALFTYADRLETVMDFTDPPTAWKKAFENLAAPTFSEANFYDAAIEVLNRLDTMPGRKALIVITTGIDTFSQATFDDVVKRASQTSTVVYAINAAEVVRPTRLETTDGPLSRVDWAAAARQLESFAKASGGRAYAHPSAISMPAIYDDIIENLRVRYRITYISSQSPSNAAERHVEVRLVDPSTGGPLEITDTAGRRIQTRVLARGSYTPAAAGHPSS